MWSSRGLSIYGKVTIINSFLIPKFVYVCSLLPTPKEIVNKLKFLWKGTDKVTRVSIINDYEKGGLQMIDLESMVKSLRLVWLKRLFNDSNATWKTYLLHLLELVGGLFFLNCNYEFLITRYLLNFTMNFCYGGRSSANLLLQKVIGKILFGIIKRFALTTRRFTIKITSSRE